MKAVMNVIKTRREKLGITQTELGDTVGVTQQTVARWEAGQFPIDIVSVEKLEKALEADRADLFPDFFSRKHAEERLPTFVTVTIGKKTGVYKLTKLTPEEVTP